MNRFEFTGPVNWPNDQKKMCMYKFKLSIGWVVVQVQLDLLLYYDRLTFDRLWPTIRWPSSCMNHVDQYCDVLIQDQETVMTKVFSDQTHQHIQVSQSGRFLNVLQWPIDRSVV